MANTTTYKHGFMTITGLDADWLFDTEMAALKTAGRYPKKHYDFHNALKIKAIKFRPGATDDILQIHEDGINDVLTFDPKMADSYDDRIMYFGEGKYMRPTIDISDCTLAAGTLANCRVMIVLADLENA